jgi:hypothetical protein
MTRLRRTLVVLAVTIAAGLGIGGTASAAFTVRVTVPPVQVSTATVAAPTGVTATPTSCDNYARSQELLLSWTPSTSPRISAYRVTVYRANGTTITTTQVSAARTSVTITVNRQAYDVSTLAFSVTSITDYGWTTESKKTGARPC